FTEAPGHATELAERAVAEGVRTVVAAGGDGTICEIADGLHRAGGGRLGILPRGTGNDTARTLGIPLQWEAAARTILQGVPRSIDLIGMDGRVVVNAIGIGLTGDINRRAARIKFIRGIAAYLVTAIVSLFRYHAPKVVMKTPDGHYTGSMIILAVHNGPTTGGGFRLTPAAKPADGRLDACLVEEIGVLKRIGRLAAGLRGTLGTMAGSHELQAPWLELAFEEPIPGHLDGNQWLFEPPSVRFETLPHALEVIVPAE
ncbi:MAG TPA: diacylglycerol kinase family lipid kinase, partial [Acidobacteria bacterium]|nr:diacylglycerol kinase family lipid kinase [Acidobacteriota bacterium]